MRAARAIVAAVVLAASSALAANAAAGPPTARSFADREEARSLAKKGYDQLVSGDYKSAIETFRKAEEHFHAPTHFLYIAQAQVKLGKLLDAEKSYRRILDEKLAADAPLPFKEAQTAARNELRELEAKVPTITISLAGSAAAQGRATLDGADVTTLGAPIRLDPGLHTINATAPGVVPIERAVSVKAGDKEVVTIALDPPPKPSIVPAVVAFSLGGAALGAGIATQILALQSSQKDDKKTLQIVAIAGFAAGGAGVTTGIVLAALRARKPPGVAAAVPARTIEIGFGVGSVTISGSF